MKYISEISNIVIIVLLLSTLIADIKLYFKMKKSIALDKMYLDCYEEYVEVNSKILHELSK